MNFNPFPIPILHTRQQLENLYSFDIAKSITRQIVNYFTL